MDVLTGFRLILYAAISSAVLPFFGMFSPLRMRIREECTPGRTLCIRDFADSALMSSLVGTDYVLKRYNVVHIHRRDNVSNVCACEMRSVPVMFITVPCFTRNCVSDHTSLYVTYF